jgi:hypothetical protein
MNDVEQQLFALLCTRIESQKKDINGMATPRGFEPLTHSLEGTYSISGFLKP